MNKFIFKIKDNKLFNLLSLSLISSDLMSGVSVALLALPQSMAYALIVGLPLHTGVLAMLIGTLTFSLLGHCKYLISGPTNATALLVQAGASALFYQYFPKYPDVHPSLFLLQIISLIVLLTGLIQTLVAVLKLGGFTRFISRSVMMGYILGVSISIWCGQLFNFFHLEKPKSPFSLWQLGSLLTQEMKHYQLPTLLFGLACLGLLITLKKKKPHWPRSLIMLSLASCFILIMKKFFVSGELKTIQTMPPVAFELKKLIHSQFFLFDTSLLKDSLVIALALSLFSIFELNSVSRLITAKKSEPISANRDIFAVGISNIIGSFFRGTLPSSGSPSRSIFNYQCGAKSRLSGLFVSLGMLILLSALYPFFQYVPKVALAALLMMIGYEIIDFKLLKICLRATKRDALVLAVTCFSCVFFQLDVALFIGVILSLILYLRLAAQTNILEYVFTEQGHFQPILKSKERTEKRIRILNMEGNLFFGSVDSLQKTLQHIIKDPDVRILILRFSHVQHMDASICYFLEVFATDLKKQGKSLYLCEMVHNTSQVVYESPLLKKLGQDYLYERDHQSPIKATEMAFAHALKKLNQETNSSS